MGANNIENDQNEVIVQIRLLTSLMIDGNVAEMSKILDPAFTLTHITGFVQPKNKWLSEIETKQMKYYAYNEVKASVAVNGSRATFIGQNLLDARIWGMRNTWRLQQTMRLEKRNGEWVILQSVAALF